MFNIWKQNPNWLFLDLLKRLLPIARAATGDPLATVSGVHVRSATSRQQVICQWLKTLLGFSAFIVTDRWYVPSHRPVPDPLIPLKTFQQSIWLQRGFTCSKQNLLPTKSYRRTSCELCTYLRLACDLPAITRRYGCNQVADRLQSMCNRGFKDHIKLK